jgi:exonuclease III
VICSGISEDKWASSGVAIWIKKQWQNKIIDYTGISDRIIKVKIKVLNQTFNIFEIYAPVEGKDQETEEFYEKLQLQLLME